MSRPSETILRAMRNLSMRRSLERGDAIDVSGCPSVDGHYDISEIEFIDGLDYCDAKTESWIWSIGRRRSDNQIIASISPDLYQNPDFECLWLR